MATEWIAWNTNPPDSRQHPEIRVRMRHGLAGASDGLTAPRPARVARGQWYYWDTGEPVERGWSPALYWAPLTKEAP